MVIWYFGQNYEKTTNLFQVLKQTGCIFGADKEKKNEQ